MVKKRARLETALRTVGAKLKRDRKHLVYELPNGSTVTMAKSPSDVRAEENAIHQLRRSAGDRPVHREGERRERKPKPGRMDSAELNLPDSVSPIADALRGSGLIEQQLRQRIGHLEARLAERDARIAELARRWPARLLDVLMGK